MNSCDTIYTLSLYPTLHYQLIETLFEAHIVLQNKDKKSFIPNDIIFE